MPDQTTDEAEDLGVEDVVETTDSGAEQDDEIILAYVILIGVGLCVCFFGMYFLVNCLRKMKQDEIKNKRKVNTVAEAEM